MNSILGDIINVSSNNHSNKSLLQNKRNPERHRLRSREPLGRRERKNGGCSSEASFAVLAHEAVKGRRAAKAISFVSFPSWEKKKGNRSIAYNRCYISKQTHQMVATICC